MNGFRCQVRSKSWWTSSLETAVSRRKWAAAVWGRVRMCSTDLIAIQDRTWYYFTVDLSWEGYASFQFVRFVDVNHNRTAAVVRITSENFFLMRDLVLLPSSTEPDYFRARSGDILTVWTFDGSGVGSAESIDLRSAWPHNILDKAAITPSEETAKRWTRD